MRSEYSKAYLKLKRIIAMVSLIAAGESIFFLPFVIARVFRPTLLEVFQITNLELGTAFSVYGVIAMLAYFPGGPLADRFSARKLIAISLITTSIGGLVMATIPSLNVLMILYAFWGLTTILLFWAALIRATRQWGGRQSQGSAFGYLDGGRGLAAALVGSFTVVIFEALLPGNIESATLAERTDALQKIFWIISSITFTVSLLVWYSLQDTNDNQLEQNTKVTLDGVRKVLGMPAVRLQAIIIICAYVGFKGTDDFSLYARDVLGYNEVEAAKAGTISLWIRPVAAICAGLLADKISASIATFFSFLLIFAGSLVIAVGVLGPGRDWMFILTIISASAGIFALRGLYYAIMQEGHVPLIFTGSAVGFVSVIGYTPDIFMGPLMGFLLDRSPGKLGHQHVFSVIAAFSFVGMITTVMFRRITRLLSNA